MDQRALKVLERLPEAAQAKLAELQADTLAAEDGIRGAQARINTAPSPALRSRFLGERDRQTRRHAALHQLVNRLHQWLAELGSVVLEMAPPEGGAAMKLKNGEAIRSAIESVRSEIGELLAQLDATRRAPLPLAAQKELAERFVAQMLNAARPAVGFVGDAIKVNPRGDMFAAQDVLAILCWAAPEQVCRALEREIESLPVRSDAMPRDERIKRVADLEAECLELERREEALVERAASAGTEVLRRPDADVRAVLGVVIAVKREAAAAAA